MIDISMFTHIHTDTTNRVARSLELLTSYRFVDTPPYYVRGLAAYAGGLPLKADGAAGKQWT